MTDEELDEYEVKAKLDNANNELRENETEECSKLLEVASSNSVKNFNDLDQTIQWIIEAKATMQSLKVELKSLTAATPLLSLTSSTVSSANSRSNSEGSATSTSSSLVSNATALPLSASSDESSSSLADNEKTSKDESMLAAPSSEEALPRTAAIAQPATGSRSPKSSHVLADPEKIDLSTKGVDAPAAHAAVTQPVADSQPAAGSAVSATQAAAVAQPAAVCELQGSSTVALATQVAVEAVAEPAVAVAPRRSPRNAPSHAAAAAHSPAVASLIASYSPESLPSLATHLAVAQPTAKNAVDNQHTIAQSATNSTTATMSSAKKASPVKSGAAIARQPEQAIAQPAPHAAATAQAAIAQPALDEHEPALLLDNDDPSLEVFALGDAKAIPSSGLSQQQPSNNNSGASSAHNGQQQHTNSSSAAQQVSDKLSDLLTYAHYKQQQLLTKGLEQINNVTSYIVNEIKKLCSGGPLKTLEKSTDSTDANKFILQAPGSADFVTYSSNGNQLSVTAQGNFYGVITIQRLDAQGNFIKNGNEFVYDIIHFKNNVICDIVFAKPHPTADNCRIFSLAQQFLAAKQIDITKDDIYARQDLKQNVDELKTNKRAEFVGFGRSFAQHAASIASAQQSSHGAAAQQMSASSAPANAAASSAGRTHAGPGAATQTTASAQQSSNGATKQQESATTSPNKSAQDASASQTSSAQQTASANSGASTSSQTTATNTQPGDTAKPAVGPHTARLNGSTERPPPLQSGQNKIFGQTVGSGSPCRVELVENGSPSSSPPAAASSFRTRCGPRTDAVPRGCGTKDNSSAPHAPGMVPSR